MNAELSITGQAKVEQLVKSYESAKLRMDKRDALKALNILIVKHALDYAEKVNT